MNFYLTTIMNYPLSSIQANKVVKAKRKIPAFGEIPFIPTISKSVTTKWEASTLIKSKQVGGKNCIYIVVIQEV